MSKSCKVDTHPIHSIPHSERTDERKMWTSSKMKWVCRTWFSRFWNRRSFLRDKNYGSILATAELYRCTFFFPLLLQKVVDRLTRVMTVMMMVAGALIRWLTARIRTFRILNTFHNDSSLIFSWLFSNRKKVNTAPLPKETKEKIFI